jgi:hypothetical protein
MSSSIETRPAARTMSGASTETSEGIQEARWPGRNAVTVGESVLLDAIGRGAADEATSLRSIEMLTNAGQVRVSVSGRTSTCAVSVATAGCAGLTIGRGNARLSLGRACLECDRSGARGGLSFSLAISRAVSDESRGDGSRDRQKSRSNPTRPIAANVLKTTAETPTFRPAGADP